jgi:asparagine synthetase B (glutamine-hydrolysing)
MKYSKTVIELAAFGEKNTPVKFICHLPEKYIFRPVNTSVDKILIGRTFKGIYCDIDGNYISIRPVDTNSWHIERDMFGSIPLFYSLKKRIITTDIRELTTTIYDNLSQEGLAEYIACSFTSLGLTIYKDVFTLRPDENLCIINGVISVEKILDYFNPPKLEGDLEQQLEDALEKSVLNLIQVAGEELILNLSGGNDSTLILALLRKASKKLNIFTNTFYHSDWRDDFDDWRYAEIASYKFGTKHLQVNIENEAFEQAHKELLVRASNVFHTYATAFFMQNLALNSTAKPHSLIVNGSGPDESMIGTEKISIEELVAMNQLSEKEWLDYAINAKDYLKIPELDAQALLLQKGAGFMENRIAFAKQLTFCGNFVEFQRRFHSMLILQDHICELSQVAAVVERPLFFPFLTNDIFRIVFGASFSDLNRDGLYKSIIKKILSKYMDAQFVNRQKIGFQSPSRKYFIGPVGFGRSIEEVLSRKQSSILNMAKAKEAVHLRLSEEFSKTHRYDFVEWAVYNLLRLESQDEIS